MYIGGDKTLSNSELPQTIKACGFTADKYKKHKEEIIKQVAEIGYKSGNITKQCYDAMMAYEVEITD